MFVVDKKVIVVEGQVHNSWNTWYYFSGVSEHYLKKASLVYLVPTDIYKQLLQLLFLQAAAVVVVYKQLLFVVYLCIVLCHSLEARQHHPTCNGWRSRRDTWIIQSNHSQYLFYWSSTTTELWQDQSTYISDQSSITRYFSPQSTEAIQSLSWVDQSTYITSYLMHFVYLRRCFKLCLCKALWRHINKSLTIHCTSVLKS